MGLLFVPRQVLLFCDVSRWHPSDPVHSAHLGCDLIWKCFLTLHLQQPYYTYAQQKHTGSPFECVKKKKPAQLQCAIQYSSRIRHCHSQSFFIEPVDELVAISTIKINIRPLLVAAQFIMGLKQHHYLKYITQTHLK